MDTEEKQAASRFCGALRYLRGFLTWVTAGLVLGLAGGLAGGAFSLAVKAVTDFRGSHGWVIWLLPAGGLLIAFLYHNKFFHPTDTNGVLLTLHGERAFDMSTAPVIFFSAVLSHLLGASVGREGAALQLGGELGNGLVRLLHVKREARDGLIMCGMSAVFAALFGTPLAAAFFAIEVASVGLLHYSAIVPCLTSAFTAVRVAELLGAEGDAFPIWREISFRGGSIAAVIAVAALCGGMSILYCLSFRGGEHLAKKYLPNPYLRIAVGGAVLIVLTLIFGADYNGAGMGMVERAVAGEARPEAFAIKLLFTVVSVSAGFKGGEIVPCLFIGSTLGCTASQLLGLDPALGAAVGLLAMFCGSLNCPISSILLGAELFGTANLYFFAIACAVSYMLSANYSLYHEQKLLYSKFRAERIDGYTE